MIPSSCVQFRWLDGHAAIPANQIPSQIDHWDGLRSPHCSILRRPLTIHLVESRCIRVGMVWLGWGGQYGMVGDMTSKPHMYSSDASTMFFKPRSLSVNLSVEVIWKSFQTKLAEKSIGWPPPFYWEYQMVIHADLIVYLLYVLQGYLWKSLRLRKLASIPSFTQWRKFGTIFFVILLYKVYISN